VDEAEELRARFVELAPEGFEEAEGAGSLELAAYGPAAERVLAAFPEARTVEIEGGWEERWREFHHAVQIGPLWVGPPWRTPTEGTLPVVIDPGRAFGTGAHPSTRLCLELLIDEKRGSLVDVGCGSGVIAIAAVRLGFAPVTALDIDETAVEVTQENAHVNGVELGTRRLDARIGGLPDADLTVANVSLEAIEAIAPGINSARFITAGYLAADRLELEPFRHVERRELDGWAADLFAR
jgi:ribosomal protein L11 methyltransferase